MRKIYALNIFQVEHNNVTHTITVKPALEYSEHISELKHCFP